MEQPIGPGEPTAAHDAAREAQRALRCALHPGRPSVGTCAGCQRALCLTCAIPVRGALVGPECLASYVEDAPTVEPVAPANPTAGDLLAIFGFAIVLVASVLPWARFNNPRIFGAWTLGWPLLSPVAAAAGVTAVVVWRRAWRIDGRAQAIALAGLAILSIVGAVVYRLQPPLLAGSSLAPLLAVLGGVVAFVGGGRKAAAVWLVR